MKISDLPMPTQQPGHAPPIAPKVTMTPKNAFEEVMQGLTRQNCNQELLKMSEEILKQGAVLAERVDLAELKRYKKLLTEFMREAVRFSFAFQKNASRERGGRHKIYATVRRINEKLEDLTQSVLNQEAETLRVMAEIDEINGLLIDLLA